MLPLFLLGFRRWLARQFYILCGRAPSSSAASDATVVIEGKAQFDEEVFSQSRPIRITRIEDFISNGDLLDRTMLVGLPYPVLMVSFFDRQAPEEAASRVYAVHNWRMYAIL